MPSSIVVEQTPPATTAPAAVEAKPAAPVAPVVDESLPEKFRGKSPSEIVSMYQELESAHGRRANELGVYRGLVEDLSVIKRSADLKAAGLAPEDEKLAPITSDDLLSDPDKTLRSVIQSELRAALKPEQQRVAGIERNIEAERFISDFPDFQTVTAKPEFHAWVAKSQLRQEDAFKASQNDYRSARRLMEDYRDVQAAQPVTKAETVSTVASTKPQGLQGAIESATEGKSGGGDAVVAGKIFKKSELMKLIANDRDKYLSGDFQKEFRLAIKEGRYKENA